MPDLPSELLSMSRLLLKTAIYHWFVSGLNASGGICDESSLKRLLSQHNGKLEELYRVKTYLNFLLGNQRIREHYKSLSGLSSFPVTLGSKPTSIGEREWQRTVMRFGDLLSTCFTEYLEVLNLRPSKPSRGISTHSNSDGPWFPILLDWIYVMIDTHRVDLFQQGSVLHPLLDQD